MEEEEIRVAIKKAHEIRNKLDDFIIHLSEVYKAHFARRNAKFSERDTVEETLPESLLTGALDERED